MSWHLSERLAVLSLVFVENFEDARAEEADSVGHSHIGTEHILLALLRVPESTGRDPHGSWPPAADRA